MSGNKINHRGSAREDTAGGIYQHDQRIERNATISYNQPTMARILSGIRPSGQMHVGHYLGAIKQWIDLQNNHDVFYMVADLHAITTPYDTKTAQSLIHNTVLDYLAAGLDPKKSSIFIQSYVPAHTQLMWLLNTMTPVGELQRMVQFKEWSEKYPENLYAGILNYPILMAADILAYKAEMVPVGDDQVQHVELAHDLAKKFNRVYGKSFPDPKPIIASGKRIMALADPMSKMSKSDHNGIDLTDTEDVIQEKMKKAVTSSEPRIIREAMHAAEAGEKTADLESKIDPNQKKQFHGVRNLFTILFALGNQSDIDTWKTAAEDGTLQFSQFKPALGKVIADHFAPFRETRAQLEQDADYVDGVIADGNAKANAVADATLLEVQQKMALR